MRHSQDLLESSRAAGDLARRATLGCESVKPLVRDQIEQAGKCLLQAKSHLAAAHRLQELAEGNCDA